MPPISTAYSTNKEATLAKSEIKAILFDLDGTLIDTYELILTSMQHATNQVLGKDLPAGMLMKKVGQPLTVQMWDFTDSQDAHDELLEVYREYNAVVHDKLAKPFDGVEGTLHSLREAGYPLGVVTSKRHKPAMQGLRLFALDGYFNCVVGSDDLEAHKPDPGPVLYGAKLVGEDPHACLYIGDSPYDILAGNGAGASTAAALWGMFSKEELLLESPTYVCKDIRDIKTLL